MENETLNMLGIIIDLVMLLVFAAAAVVVAIRTGGKVNTTQIDTWLQSDATLERLQRAYENAAESQRQMVDRITNVLAAFAPSTPTVKDDEIVAWLRKIQQGVTVAGETPAEDAPPVAVVEAEATPIADAQAALDDLKKKAVTEPASTGFAPEQGSRMVDADTLPQTPGLPLNPNPWLQGEPWRKDGIQDAPKHFSTITRPLEGRPVTRPEVVHRDDGYAMQVQIAGEFGFVTSELVTTPAGRYQIKATLSTELDIAVWADLSVGVSLQLVDYIVPIPYKPLSEGRHEYAWHIELEEAKSFRVAWFVRLEEDTAKGSVVVHYMGIEPLPPTAQGDFLIVK